MRFAKGMARYLTPGMHPTVNMIAFMFKTWPWHRFVAAGDAGH
jgi:hypothetical protein